MKEDHVKQLRKYIEDQLPQMVEMCKTESDVVMFHQDAYAADYQPQEYLLLGMVIKYIGLSGKQIHIIGKNRETLK